MMKIKQIPGDFYVREEMKLEIDENGKYSYYLLKKVDKDFFYVLREIYKIFRTREKNIGYAGIKDKRAITEQYISVFMPNTEIIEKEFDGFTLKFIGRGDERINLGDLEGNYFKIIARDLDKKIKIKFRFKNYFDEQRFGADGKNHLIGRYLIKKELRKACELIRINADGNDYVKALRSYGIDMLRFYVNAYQSYLWNQVAEKIDNVKEIPILGYLTEFKNKKVKSIYDKILKEGGVTKDDFLMRFMPEIASEGGTRKLYEEAYNLKSKWDKDEMNDGKLKCVLEFKLDKGVYATIFLKSTFGN